MRISLHHAIADGVRLSRAERTELAAWILRTLSVAERNEALKRAKTPAEHVPRSIAHAIAVGQRRDEAP